VPVRNIISLRADTGFRPAWLGHHGSHFEITAYQLKGLSLPWFTPGLERMIMNHHAQDEDPSPSLPQRAGVAGVGDLVTTIRADARKLPFPPE